MTDWEVYWKKQNAWVKELVRRGIPVHFRAIAWQLLCSATEAPEKKLYADYIKVRNYKQLVWHLFSLKFEKLLVKSRVHLVF